MSDVPTDGTVQGIGAYYLHNKQYVAARQGGSKQIRGSEQVTGCATNTNAVLKAGREALSLFARMIASLDVAAKFIRIEIHRP